MNKILRGTAVAALILSLGLCGHGVADDHASESAALPTAVVEETVEETKIRETVNEAEEAEDIAEDIIEAETTEASELPEATSAPIGEEAEEMPDGSSVEATQEPDDALCVLEADWNDSDIQTIFASGVVATITDVRTGISWQEVRCGGSNHADVQPCTAKDAAKLKKVYGGDWSWKRRAIWVTIDGKTYAASMNGMPHGQGSVSGNNFDGHHCIHFTNSRTHSSKKIDTNHQKMIRRALSAAQ